MSGDDFGRLIYLGLLAVVVGGYFLLQNRTSLGKVAQQVAVWGLIFVGVAAGYGLWHDIVASNPQLARFSEDGQITVPRAQDGHYYLTLTINQKPVDFMIDTGATDVVLTLRDAKAVGIETDGLSYLGQAQTANGTVRTARVRLQDVQLGKTDQGGLVAWVNEGDLDISLLGMTYLQRFARMEIAGDQMILTP